MKVLLVNGGPHKEGCTYTALTEAAKELNNEGIETAWVPIIGKNYEYIYCLWVAGSFKRKGIAKELLEYAINDSKEKGMNGICTLVSKQKKPYVGEKKFFEHYGFKAVDSIADYELLVLKFEDGETSKFNDNAKENNIKVDFIKIDSLGKAKNAPCIFNNWADFYKGEFISNTILNANSFKKLVKE